MPSVIDQLISHLERLGIRVHNTAEMQAFLEENGADSIEQYVKDQKEMEAIKQKAIADGTFMKAPNGKPTNLTERQWLQVRTTNFKNWFGDWENDPANASKVVDENGEPLVVYHGGKNNISTFVTYHQDDEVGDMYGAYFTKDKNYAKSYNKGALYEVFLNIRKPLATEGKWTGVINKDRATSITGKYDGIVNDKFDNGILNKLHLAKTRTEIIVFNPNQIKSATANNGDFSLTNNDIEAFIDKYDLPEGEFPLLYSALITKYGNKTAYGDVICTADYEYTVNYKGAGEFDIIEYHEINNNINDIINDTEREGISEAYDSLSTRDEITKGEYPSDSYHTENREANGDNAGLDIQAPQRESDQTSSDVSGQQYQEWRSVKRDSATARIAFVKGDGRTNNSVENLKDIETFATPQGEIYGFVDADGEVYFDKDAKGFSSEHVVHEYTHLWDRVIQKKNPKFWARGVYLMQHGAASLWNDIANSPQYGQKWIAMGLSGTELENKIASEVHARLTGENGKEVIEKIEKEQGPSGIIGKLKNWLKKFWGKLRETFGVWTDRDLAKIELDYFVNMPIRDFITEVNLDEAKEVVYKEDGNGQHLTNSEDVHDVLNEYIKGREMGGEEIAEGITLSGKDAKPASVLCLL